MVEKIDAIREGVNLIAEGVNTYDKNIHKELKYALGTVHSVLLNRIAYVVLEAVAERCEFDDRFYPVICDAARLVKKTKGE
ncbi:MAG: hypothetical protein C4542_00480 [Dehalococcoidia bacterium]|nr:MAG: hypothetical protein C4542_00480 [Dehalococcoidia bacterium]